MEETTRIARNPKAAFRSLGDSGGGVLLHVETTAYHNVNETGALIWTLLEDGPSFNELVHRLEREMEGIPPDFRDEVGTFLRELADRDLITLGQA
jgi:hypothetical protein